MIPGCRRRLSCRYLLLFQPRDGLPQTRCHDHVAAVDPMEAGRLTGMYRMAFPVRDLVASDLRSTFCVGLHRGDRHAEHRDQDHENECCVQMRPNNPVHRRSPCSMREG
jgi:hypothetical protein